MIILITRKEREVLELRKQGLTQVEVAKKLKISQAAVSKFEKNALEKIKDAKRVLKFSKKLGIEVDDDELAVLICDIINRMKNTFLVSMEPGRCANDSVRKLLTQLNVEDA